jgi:hypothetical protein
MRKEEREAFQAQINQENMPEVFESMIGTILDLYEKFQMIDAKDSPYLSGIVDFIDDMDYNDNNGSVVNPENMLRGAIGVFFKLKKIERTTRKMVKEALDE